MTTSYEEKQTGSSMQITPNCVLGLGGKGAYMGIGAQKKSLVGWPLAKSLTVAASLRLFSGPRAKTSAMPIKVAK